MSERVRDHGTWALPVCGRTIDPVAGTSTQYCVRTLCIAHLSGLTGDLVRSIKATPKRSLMTCQDGSNRHDFDQKRAKKRVDHARNDQPLNCDTCVGGEVGQLLCVEFVKEPAKGNLFALRSLVYEL